MCYTWDMLRPIALTLLATAAVASADVQMQPTRLALFKNGYGFVTLRGELDDAASTRLGPLPVPSVGTFWVGVGEGARLKSLVAGMHDFEVPQVSSLEMRTLVYANPGRKVSIRYELSEGEAGYATGTIIPLPQEMEPRPGNVIGGLWKPSTSAARSPLVMLRTEEGKTLIVPEHALLSLTFEGEFNLPANTESRPAVELQLEAPAPGVPVEASCLAAGITWQPSYRFELGEAGRGLLSAQATITNNLMDIDHAEVELITGYPSLEYAGEIDPIAVKWGLSELLRSGRGARLSRAMQVVACNNMAQAVAEEEEGEEAPTPSPAEGVQTADLFFYPLPDFSARAGEVVMRPLFSTPVDYRSIYVWEVGDPRTFSLPSPGEVRQQNEVWHCIRFTNPLEMPLTTASVEFLEKGRIAGTNTISYTPAKRECTTRMNQAVNVPVRKESRLLSQQRSTLPHHGSVMENNSAVTLALTNGTGEAMDAEIMQRLDGTVLDAGDGEVHTTGTFSGPAGSNPATIIRWKLHLEPGESREVGFRYMFYR